MVEYGFGRRMLIEAIDTTIDMSEISIVLSRSAHSYESNVTSSANMVEVVHIT